MKRLFRPATALMKRFGYNVRFALLGTLFLLAIGVLALNWFASLETLTRASRQQLQSVQLVRPMLELAQEVQLHRGLSNAVLNGNTGLAGRLAEQRHACTAALDKLRQRLPPIMAGGTDWLDLQADWSALSNSGLTWTAEQNFATHTHILADLRILEAVHAQGAEVDLVFLLDISTSKLPTVIEHLGRLRAVGTSVLTRRQIAEDEKRQLIGIMANLNDSLTSLTVGFDKAADHNPTMASALRAAAKGISASSLRVAEIVETDIISARFANSPQAFLARVTEAVDSNYAHIYGSLLPTVEKRLQQRISQAENVLRLSTAFAMVLFLIVVYFSIGIYLATVDSIRTLALAARAFAAGDFGARVELDSGDELQRIGHAFNEMARGFADLLAERQRAEELLRTAAAEIEDLYDNAPCGYHSLDAKGMVIRINKTELDWLGYAREDLIGRAHWCSLVAPASAGHCGVSLERLVKEGAALDQELEVTRKDGRVFTGLVNATAVYDRAGTFTGSRSTMYDITERQRSAERIRYLAHHDALTGLPNRALMMDRLAQDMKKAHRLGHKVALLFIDLDRFKEVNDTLGHDVGDLLLQEAARRITGCVRDTDTVARLGGDEFTVILTALERTEGISPVGERILHAIGQPFVLGAETAYVTASIGVTLYPDDASSMEDLLKDADQAMYAAKNAGRNRISYFTPALQQTAQARLRLISDLRIALAAGQFSLHYQPIIHLATGQICHAEALIRWQHPERGMVMPCEFIPAAEETGLIVEMGNWVFMEAVQQVQRWRQLFNAKLQISVNVSPVQFHHDGMQFRSWIEHMNAIGLAGQSIGIEITEGLLLDSEDGVLENLLAFRDAGVQVAVDDFGTGYSSLAYLKKFDIDYLKIDRTFVRELATDANDRALCEAIVAMAHKLGLKVIAEGVETEAQRQLLADLSCDFAQGYLFSRPVPAGQFEALLEQARLGNAGLGRDNQRLESPCAELWSQG